MNKTAAIIFFIVGILLLNFAFFAGDSVSAGLSKLVRGTPDYPAITLGLLGLMGLIAGTVSISRQSES